MGWLFGKKSDNILDLTERYRKQQENLVEKEAPAVESISSTDPTGGFGIFGMTSSSVSTSDSSSNNYEDVSPRDDKRKKLIKRIMDMTEKMEDLSNQIYHLQQRIEVLEKKSSVRGY